MQKTTVKLFTLGTLAAAATFGANAQNTYDYFIGFDAGTHVGGKLKVSSYDAYDPTEIYSYDSSVDTAPSLITGLSGGAIINDHHRVKLSLAYDGFALDVDGPSETLDRADLSASYDYMLPIANKLNWTIGAHMGYELFYFETDQDDIEGFTYGVQTGVDYRLNENWSLGTEIAYTVHDEEKNEGEYANGGKYGSSLRIEDDVTLMANIQYHF